MRLIWKSMNPTTRKALGHLSPLLVAIALTGVGCLWSSKIKPKAWNVSITKNTESTIVVDLIGITEEEKPEWEGYPIDKYWTPGDQKRADATDKWSKSLEMGKYETMDSKDEHWKKWLGRGVTHLLIIARLPGTHPPGPADPRRKIISLDKGEWKGNTLEFEVRATGIRILTPRKK